MKLNQIADNPGARKTRHRIGRGIGSGCGKTGGRGGKGQTARSGVRIKGFEGGQMPLHRRLPKRGFKNTAFQIRLTEINVGDVQEAIDAGMLNAGSPIDVDVLVKAGVLRRPEGRREAARRRRAQGQGGILGLARLEIGDRRGREGRRFGEDPGAEEGSVRLSRAARTRASRPASTSRRCSKRRRRPRPRATSPKPISPRTQPRREQGRQNCCHGPEQGRRVIPI